MNGGPGLDVGGVHPRRQPRPDAGADRRPARRLVVGGRDVARGHSARPDRAHRDPARPGVEPLRRRRDRRRDPGVHEARGGQRVGAERRRRLRHLRHAQGERRVCAVRWARLRFSLQAGGTRSTRLQRDRQSRTTSATTATATATRSENAGLNAALPWAEGQEIAVQYFRNRLNNQYDGGAGFDDRTITTLEAWSVVSRNRIGERWTSLADRRRGQRRLACRRRASATIRSRRRSGNTSGRTTSRCRWARCRWCSSGARSISPPTPAFAVTERDTNSATGVYQVRYGAFALQANLRHDNSSQYGGKTTGGIARRLPALAGAGGVTAGYSTGFKAPSFNDLYYPFFSQPGPRSRRPRATRRRASTGRRRPAMRAGRRARSATTTASTTSSCSSATRASIACRSNVDRATLEGRDARRSTSRGATRSVQGVARPAGPRTTTRTGNLLPRRARQHGAVQRAAAGGAGAGRRRVRRVVAALRRRGESAEDGRLRHRQPDADWPFAQGLVAARARQQRVRQELPARRRLLDGWRAVVRRACDGSRDHLRALRMDAGLARPAAVAAAVRVTDDAGTEVALAAARAAHREPRAARDRAAVCRRRGQRGGRRRRAQRLAGAGARAAARRRCRRARPRAHRGARSPISSSRGRTPRRRSSPRCARRTCRCS